MASSVDIDHSLMEYRRSVRGKASNSLNELRRILDREPSVTSDTGDRAESVEYSDYSYGAAGHRLRSLLSDVSQSSAAKTVLFAEHVHGTPSSAGHRTVDEPTQMMHSETRELQQLCSRNEQLTRNLDKLKQRLLEVIEENNVLHVELKRSVVDDIVKTTGEPLMSTPVISMPAPAVSMPTKLTPVSHFSHQKWQTELERMNSLHKAKTSTLEAQLQFAREECNQYKTKLRQLESAVDAPAQLTGLCISCSQNEAVVSTHQASVDTLTHERDELASQLAKMNVHVEQLTAREADAYQQVKACIELAEQSQMDMSQAVIEREQVREQLENMQRRFEDSVAETQRRISKECDIVRHEGHNARQQLELRVKELLEQLSEVQCSLEKCQREKSSVTAELELTHSQLNNVDDDYSKATDNMKVSMTQANFERNLAVQQVTRLKQEIDQLSRDRHAEKCRLKSELEDVKRRLMQAEKELLAAKDECIQLHEANQALQNHVNTVNLAKESIERSCTDNIDAAEKRAELRETELNKLIVSLQAKHVESSSHLEMLISKHESLITKLRQECHRLVTELEQVSTKYKTDNERLCRQNEELQGKVALTSRQCRELSNRLTQQSQVQEKMRHRIHEMDGQVQLSSQQKLDLLAKESVLLRDRQQLARRVEFLQRQLMTPTVNCDTANKAANCDIVDNSCNGCDSIVEKMNSFVTDDLVRLDKQQQH